MTLELARDICLDALKDSIIIFLFVYLVHFLLAYVEENISHFLVKKKRTAPIYGSAFGLIPQCGTSVLGADLYLKKYISIGTLVAIFLSCSDEAFIVLLTSNSPKMFAILPLFGLKFAIGFISGMLIDLVSRSKGKTKNEYIEDHKCHQHHDEENDAVHKYIVHPLIHSLQIFVYVLIINLVLGFIVGFVGEDNFKNFISSNRYMAPVYSSLIGLIPNCSSSIFISELFINGNLSFGALLSGLLVNSGLGAMILIKNRKTAKDVILILSICFAISILSGYIACLVSGF